MHVGQTVYCLAKDVTGTWCVVDARVVSHDEKAVCVATPGDLLSLSLGLSVQFANRDVVFEQEDHAQALCKFWNDRQREKEEAEKAAKEKEEQCPPQ